MRGNFRQRPGLSGLQTEGASTALIDSPPGSLKCPTGVFGAWQAGPLRDQADATAPACARRNRTRAGEAAGGAGVVGPVVAADLRQLLRSLCRMLDALHKPVDLRRRRGR